MRTPFSLLVVFSLFISVPGWSNSRAPQLFQLCASCHGMQGEGRTELGAPAIAGMPLWYLKNQLEKFRNGGRGKHFDDFYGMRMRPMARSLRRQEDLDAVAVYVSKLQAPQLEHTVQGNATAGEGAYVTCTACHGAKAEGNEALKAPPLNVSNDWYYLRQLKNFKSGVRGYDAEKDPDGTSVMAPMATVLADENAMKDVISYIKTLKK